MDAIRVSPRLLVLVTTALVGCGSADGSALFGAPGAGGSAAAGTGGSAWAGDGGRTTGGAGPAPTATAPGSGGSAGVGGQPPASFDGGPDPSVFPDDLADIAACNYTGTWATFIRVPVSWPAAPLVLLAGEGEIYQWNLSRRRHVAPLDTEEDSVPCGIFLPDLQADVLQTFQRYGIRFPDAIFDQGEIAPATFGSHATIGEQLTIETDIIATLVGLEMSAPSTAAWPPAAYTPLDHDLDDALGVTVVPVEADGYNYPPVGLPPLLFADLPRARTIHIITRSVARLSGAVASCDEIRGNVHIQTVAGTPGINSTVIGCVKLDGADCVEAEWEFINDNRPQFVPTGPGEFTSVRLDDEATCSDARARFPKPE